MNQIHAFYKDVLESEMNTYPIEFFDFLYTMICDQAFLEKSMIQGASAQEQKNSKQKSRQSSFHMSPEKICALFSDKVNLEYGSWASKVLRRWGVASSLDVGKAVFLMAEFDYLSLSGTETLEDFEAAGLDNVE